MPKRYWIQRAIKHRGVFDRYCHSNHASESCIRRGMHSRNKTIRRRAILAETLKHLHRI